MNKKIKIFFPKTRNLEKLDKKKLGLKVLIQIDNSYYLLNFISIEKVTKDYELSQKENKLFYIPKETIVTYDMNKNWIINCIIKLNQKNHFNSLNIEELHDLKNWIKVY